MNETKLTEDILGKLDCKNRNGILKPVSGGDINKAFRLEAGGESFFIKVNSATRYPGMFEAEARGLELLRLNSPFIIPRALATGTYEDDAWLALEYIEKGHPSASSVFESGKALAAQHAVTDLFFGLDHDNYIGLLPQINTQKTEWEDFFSVCRLEPLVRRAVDKQLLDTSLLKHFEKLYLRCKEIFPPEKPALLHGDLWGGNYMFDSRGKACIYDPAVYFGHREMDMGMTLLFGGFSEDFYEGYHEIYPLEKNWKYRSDICNLYPLLVHLNLFGRAYHSAIAQTIRKF